MRRVFSHVLLPAVIALLGCVIVTPLSMRIAAQPYMHRSQGSVPHADIALVLGASVARGEPSPVLEARARTAAQLYRSGKVDRIFVTGSIQPYYDEITPVLSYLARQGVPESAIGADPEGFDTYSSMYRAREILEVRRVTIVTQDFHLPRAVYIARALGLDAYGIDAGGNGSAFDYVREIPASVKALLDLFLERVPEAASDRAARTASGEKV